MMKTTTEKMMNIVNNNSKEMTATLEAVCDLVIEMKIKNIDNIRMAFWILQNWKTYQKT